MRRYIFIFYLSAVWTLACCSDGARNVSGFIHATYSVGGRLKNMDEIRQSDFRQIQFVYLMACPPLEMADFARDKQFIADKYVNNFSYPAGEEGDALVPF